MAAIKLVYIGGGSSRGAGTMASFLDHGSEFDGSEFVIKDVNPDRLDVVETIAPRIAKAQGLDIAITSTTDHAPRLADADAVLASFRPGDFAARALDERIPLKHGVIGQETQGPGGFFMSLRSIHIMRGHLRDLTRSRRGRASSTTRTRSTSCPRRSPAPPDPHLVHLRGPDRVPEGRPQGGRASTRRS